MKNVFAGIFCVSMVLISGGCVTFEESFPLLMSGQVLSPKVLSGVWTLKGSDTPTYEIIPLISGPSSPVETGVRRDFIFLINPPIVGDKVYQEENETFFFKDQLKKEVFPVFELKEGIRSYHVEVNDGSSEEFIVEDDYDWGCQYGGEFPYIYGVSLENRLKGGKSDRIYLHEREIPFLIAEKGGWAHFFKREDLILLNP